MIIAEWTEGAVEVAYPAAGPQAPLWLRTDVVGAYERVGTVVARRGSRIVGVWYVPLDDDVAGTHARRRSRLLPYAAPWLMAGHPQSRRSATLEMLRAVQDHVVSVDLPLAPGFDEVTGCSELGVDVAWRHTRVVPRDPRWREHYTARVRNHVRAGIAAVTIDVQDGVEGFDFARGVVGDSAPRAAFARVLTEAATVRCITAAARGGAAGQALVVACGSTAYFFHSWFARDGPRGVPSVLVDASIDLSFGVLDVGCFDFEGSVLPRVDHFMSGFGGEVRCYPHLRWPPVRYRSQAEPP